ncbi:hypothetical protein MPSEU_000021800 [Mayamaea pseudoterrestris]|nr:hypothetical protein MPSEU_000021800 [Mayamaea pseudoterrestris]
MNHDVESLLEEKKLLNLSPNNSKRTRRFDQCRPVILLAIGAAIVLLLLFLFLPYPSPPYTKPKSKYPADTRISVVVMNHSRPRMIRESLLMKTLTEHDAVTEILLCHSNPLTKFTFDHVKVKNIDAVQANEEHGLSLRFWYCRQAQHQFVLHIDDDMELSPHALDDLLSEFTLNTHRIVGKYGRSYSYWRNLPRSGYDAATLGGPVEVVLTKILLLERSMCDAFFRHAHLVEQDVMKESRPLWNGEDIFVNLVANHEYNVPINGPYNNFAIKDLDVWEASDSFKDDDTGEHDVSGNMDRHRPWNVGWAPWLKAYRRSQAHAAFRGRLWYIAKQRLAQQK